jgi:hypothetical protein
MRNDDWSGEGLEEEADAFSPVAAVRTPRRGEGWRQEGAGSTYADQDFFGEQAELADAESEESAQRFAEDWFSQRQAGATPRPANSPPRAGMPQAGAPRAGAPQAGAPRAGAPHAGALLALADEAEQSGDALSFLPTFAGLAGRLAAQARMQHARQAGMGAQQARPLAQGVGAQVAKGARQIGQRLGSQPGGMRNIAQLVQRLNQQIRAQGMDPQQVGQQLAAGGRQLLGRTLSRPSTTPTAAASPALPSWLRVLPDGSVEVEGRFRIVPVGRGRR